MLVICNFSLSSLLFQRSCICLSTNILLQSKKAIVKVQRAGRMVQFFHLPFICFHKMFSCYVVICQSCLFTNLLIQFLSGAAFLEQRLIQCHSSIAQLAHLIIFDSTHDKSDTWLGPYYSLFYGCTFMLEKNGAPPS